MHDPLGHLIRNGRTMLPHCGTIGTIGQRPVPSRDSHDGGEYHMPIFVPGVDALGWYHKL